MNWTEITRNWNRSPVITSVTPPIDPAHVFTVIRDGCVPFIRGMRHFALPALTFEADGHVITAPSDWLPSLEDHSPSDHRSRLEGRAETWRLRLTEPLFTDHRLWSQVRDLLMPLWQTDVGMPVLAVASELVIAEGAEVCESESGHVGLVVIVSGAATLHDGETVRKVTAGGVVHLPAAGTGTVRADESCMALRLRVPVEKRLPTAEALKILTGVIAADAAEAAEPVPQPPFPPPVRGYELLPPESEAGERPPHRPDFVAGAASLAQLWWAGRASAAALDPAPDPAEPEPLRPDDVVRLAAPILVASGIEPDTDLWAVNGMAFTVSGPVPDQVLQRLQNGESITVDRLCRDDDGDHNGAEPLVDRLHALRAIDLVEGATS